MSRDRIEFSKPVYAEIVQRATKQGRIYCEGCGSDVTGKIWAVDHSKADGLRDKSIPAEKLTAEDGKLLGEACCHKPKTKEDNKQIKKAIAQGKSANGTNSNFKRQKGQKMKSRPSAKSTDPDRNKRDPFPTLPRRSLYQPQPKEESHEH